MSASFLLVESQHQLVYDGACEIVFVASAGSLHEGGMPLLAQAAGQRRSRLQGLRDGTLPARRGLPPQASHTSHDQGAASLPDHCVSLTNPGFRLASPAFNPPLGVSHACCFLLHVVLFLSVCSISLVLQGLSKALGDCKCVLQSVSQFVKY